MSPEKINIELVDADGQTVGLKEKFEAHKNPVRLHRAISVLIFDENGTKLLLQQRAGNKPTWPLFWSNTVCTHPYPGEGYKNAAERRLMDELGFSVSLEEAFRFIYQAEYDATWGEHEYDVVFLGKYDGQVKPDPDEVGDYKWISVKDLLEDIKENPENFTPWFKIILERLKLG